VIDRHGRQAALSGSAADLLPDDTHDITHVRIRPEVINRVLAS
jgi:hypothetical protein